MEGKMKKEKCYCGKPINHTAKELAKSWLNMDKILRKHTVEYKTPKPNGEIGTMLGVPIFIKK